MKALLLTNEYPPHVYGGAGVHVDYLSRALARLISVEVRCFGEQDAAGPPRVRGYGIDEKWFAATDRRLRSPLQALARCARFAADPVDADVVHCHTWYTHLGGIAIKLAYGLPLVITTHSLEPQRAWKREQLGRGYALSSWIERTALEAADRVIAVSRGMRDDVVRQFAVDPARVAVIHNGVDTDEYRPVTTRQALAAYGIDPQRPYVLFVGRITRQKGILHLLRAAAHLPADTQVVLCAGSPDTETMAGELAAAVQALQQQRAGVIWIPEMVARPRLIELYSHAAVFCCPSIYEPFGIINLEAMACGTPVVASAVGGIKEVVQDGETGVLVDIDGPDADGEPRDPEVFARALAAALGRLLADAALRRRLGAAGRRRAVEHFSWPAIARDVVRLYESLRG